LVEETGVLGENHKPVASHWQTCCIEYNSLWTGFELTTLVVIFTDCRGKFNYQIPWRPRRPLNEAKCYKKYVKSTMEFIVREENLILISWNAGNNYLHEMEYSRNYSILLIMEIILNMFKGNSWWVPNARLNGHFVWNHYYIVELSGSFIGLATWL
jgi:hypothetical protein